MYVWIIGILLVLVLVLVYFWHSDSDADSDADSDTGSSPDTSSPLTKRCISMSTDAYIDKTLVGDKYRGQLPPNCGGNTENRCPYDDEQDNAIEDCLTDPQCVGVVAYPYKGWAYREGEWVFIELGTRYAPTYKSTFNTSEGQYTFTTFETVTPQLLEVTNWDNELADLPDHQVWVKTSTRCE